MASGEGCNCPHHSMIHLQHQYFSPLKGDFKFPRITKIVSTTNNFAQITPLFIVNSPIRFISPITKPGPVLEGKFYVLYKVHQAIGILVFTKCDES